MGKPEVVQWRVSIRPGAGGVEVDVWSSDTGGWVIPVTGQDAVARGQELASVVGRAGSLTTRARVTIGEYEGATLSVEVSAREAAVRVEEFGGGGHEYRWDLARAGAFAEDLVAKGQASA